MNNAPQAGGKRASKSKALAKGSSAAKRGRAAATTSPNRTAKPESKTEKVVTLLQRPDGVTLDALVAATGWQPHTTRAALTGLKKKGHVLSSEKIDGVRRYRASPPQ